MEQLGKYLYCIIPCKEERTFGGVTPVGGGAEAVYTIPNDGLAAVVGDSPVQEHESTRANLLAHQRVQERVMLEFTVLPVRFGTVAGPAFGVEGIRKLLERRAQEFGGLLAEVEGRVELGLKALWRDARLPFEEIVSQDEAIRRLRASLDGKPLAATHFERVRLGEMVKKALDRKRSAEAARILAPLRRLAYRTAENTTVLDRMLVNAAFLVDRRREEDFDAAVQGLDVELGHRIAFRYLGPTPPYNFVNITVNWRDL